VPDVKPPTVPDVPEVPEPGIVSQAKGAAAQAQGAAPEVPGAGAAPGGTGIGGAEAAAAVGGGALGAVAAAGAAAKGAGEQPGATILDEGQKIASASTPAPSSSAVQAAREGAETAAAAKDLPQSAPEIAKEKVEVAALGTKEGQKLARAKAVEEDAAKKRADLERALKEKSSEPVKPDDSSDIEE